MTEKQAEEYLLSKPEAVTYYPFGDDVKVFKVKNKMFATLSLGKGSEKDAGNKISGHYCINLKCDPEEAVMLRDIFSAVIPQSLLSSY
ncbi:MAG: MmcQ/YjbR family DNA-binding protein [Colwellia sp.]|nr:MmcQ/YjbR family DNA-binding protein [Colwellia sp.]